MGNYCERRCSKAATGVDISDPINIGPTKVFDNNIECDDFINNKPADGIRTKTVYNDATLDSPRKTWRSAAAPFHPH